VTVTCCGWIRGCLDVQEFTALAERARGMARSGDMAGAAGLFLEALALWRGPAVEDAAPWCPWLAGEAARLEEARAAVAEERVECDLALGRHGDTVTEIASLAEAFPLRGAADRTADGGAVAVRPPG